MPMISSRSRRRLATLGAFLLMTTLASAACAQDAYVAIEQRLSAEQIKATGLDKLDPAELALLNQLLREERATATAVRPEPAASAGLSVRKVNEPVQSSLKGEFRGWSTGTLLQLENGQTWRVTEGDYNTRAVSNPKVTIRPGVISGWYLEVEGQSRRAKVRRIK